MVRFNHFNKDSFLKTTPTNIYSPFTIIILCNPCHQFEIKEFCLLAVYAYGVQHNGFYGTSTFLTIQMCKNYGCRACLKCKQLFFRDG